MAKAASAELVSDATGLRTVGPLLVTGGTFDPPHRGHTVLPRAVRTALWGDRGWLVYIPAGQSPLKARGPEALASHRVAMLRAALEGVERCAIWTDEIDRQTSGTPTYTVETLRRLRDQAGRDVEARLLIGADQAVDFHRWREFREVMALAEPVVVPRSPWTTAGLLVAAIEETGVWSGMELAAWADRFVDAPVMNVSATEVRRLLGQRSSDEARLAEVLGPEVLSYIGRHGLYERPPEACVPP